MKHHALNQKIIASVTIWRVRKTLWFWVYLCDSISPELIVDDGR